MYNYYNIPFGAQLLLWSSRMAIHGCCRTKPNKYEFIDIAYKKAGIKNGCLLLKNFLSCLKFNELFKMQPIHKHNLSETEINLINCIEDSKEDSLAVDYFIKLWNVENVNFFKLSTYNLAQAYRKVSLDTNLNAFTYKNNSYFMGEVSRVLH